MTETAYYHLKKPGDNDNVFISDLNANADAIDQALHGKVDLNADIAMDGHRITGLPKPAGDTEPLRRQDGLSAAVAALLGLAAGAVPDDAFRKLSGSVLHSDSGLTDVLGNPVGVRMVVGSYTGTGLHGADHPTSLALPFAPLLVLVHTCGDEMYGRVDCYALSDGYTPYGYIASLNGKCETYSGYYAKLSGNTVSLYCGDSTGAALKQFNYTGEIYDYLAIG